MKKDILLATTNIGKLEEIQSLLTQFSLNSYLNLLTLKDFPTLPDVSETETTFLGNALLKAKTYHNLTHMPVISDDSGLVVPSLNGEPGVYSARYAGKNATFQDNIEKLLQKMQQKTERYAYFTSFIVFLTHKHLYNIAEGYCYGEIAQNPVGKHGFGYDPIFYLPNQQCTMAQISLEEKQKISHRSQALIQLLPILKYYATT